MNKQDQDMLIELFILSMQGKTDYELHYHYPESYLLTDIAIKVSSLCKFLIAEYDKNIPEVKHEDKIKQQEA